MTEGTNIKISREDHKSLMKLRGELMQQLGSDVSIADVVHWLLEKVLREAEKK